MAEFDLDWQYRVAEALGNVDAMRSIVEQRDRENAIIAERNRKWHEDYQRSLANAPSPPAPVATSTVAPLPSPLLPRFNRIVSPSKNIKSAPSDIIQFDEESVEIALIQDLIFEDVGATELSNISRSDLIDGQNVTYSPIKNLSEVRREFNPNNIVATAYAMSYFSRFGIDIDSRGIHEPYFDDSGNLIIEVDSVEDGEELQVQIISDGTIDLVDEL